MKSLLPMAVAVATASFVPSSLAGPSDSALENANGNAKFLRCGTEHPSAADAVKQEKRFRELFRQTQNGKKPDRPGGGNGGGNGAGHGGFQTTNKNSLNGPTDAVGNDGAGGGASPNCTTNRESGAGADGYVMIEEFYSQ